MTDDARSPRRAAFEDGPFPRVTVRSGEPGSRDRRPREVLDRERAGPGHHRAERRLHADLRGKHTVTIGTHNEFFKFRNLFIRDNFGSYTFNTIDFLDQGLAQQFDHSFSATNDPKQRAEFKVRQLGFYVGDQWRVRSNVTLTTGVRVDVPMFPDKPTANPVADSNFGYATDVVPSGMRWSPRIGFNYR